LSQTQQGRTGRDALVDLLQEPWVAVLVLYMATGLPLVGFFVDVGGLGWLLRTQPGGPGLPFHSINLTQLDLACLVEVPHGRVPPRLAYPFQVGRDGLLIYTDVVGDLLLSPTL
jgi:hypothetical protein